MRRLAGIALLTLLLGRATGALAQGIPVYDNANFLQNIVTAAQTTISAVEAVFHSAEWVNDLESLGDITVAGGIAEDMATLGTLVEQAEGLSYDVGSLQAQITALFALDTAPETTQALQERLAAIRRTRYQSYSYAMRVQTLLMTAARTVEHLQGLLDTLAGVVGNKQANQTNGQFQSVAAKHLANLDVQMASYQRAGAVDKMEELLTIESLRKINDKVFER
jgi:conjugal transfer/entry exclusion protein